MCSSESQLHQDAEELESIFRTLFQLMRTRHLHDASRWNLTLSQFIGLMILGERGEMKMSELAANLALSDAAATNMIDRLVKSGLAQRDPDAQDRRVVLVHLTAKGADIVAQILVGRRQTYSAALGTLSSGDRQQVLEGMRLFIKALQSVK